MIRRFLPLWFPILLTAIVSAVNYGFWQVESAGEPITLLPDQTFAGEVVGISRATATDPFSEPCAWRVRLSPDALAALGGIELAYGERDATPVEEAWSRVPTGCTDLSFTTELAPPAKRPSRIWLRASKPGGEGVWWALAE